MPSYQSGSYCIVTTLARVPYHSLAIPQAIAYAASLSWINSKPFARGTTTDPQAERDSKILILFSFQVMTLIVPNQKKAIIGRTRQRLRAHPSRR
jgi:hypothetical protein